MLPLPFVASSYPVRSHNSVQYWIDGEAAFVRLCQAIEAAQHSVYATITFMWAAFRMPHNRGTALEVLSRAAARGVDVRLIFWRPDHSTAHLRKNAFWGAPEHFAELLEHPNLSIRWDCATPGYCQHQKSWLLDSSLAFLGGLNLNPNSVVSSGHFGEGHEGAAQNHDLYIELEGEAVVDVQHNFLARWNHASERHKPDGSWGQHSDLEFRQPVRFGTGSATVQIQRTVHAGRDPNLPNGEQSIFAQHLAAIQAAQRSIYLEHQYLESPQIVEALHHALERGVTVVALLPINPDVSATPERQVFLQARARLGQFEGFTLAGMAGLGTDGTRRPVWIHAKLVLIDDAWVLVGSANLHRYSLFGNAELNAAIDSPDFAKALRVALFWEHLGMDTAQMNDLEALACFARVAWDNRNRWLVGNHAWQGLVVALEVENYGFKPSEAS
jgi:cardiolipin synthase A/B